VTKRKMNKRNEVKDVYEPEKKYSLKRVAQTPDLNRRNP